MNRILLFLLLMGNITCMETGYQPAMSEMQHNAIQEVEDTLIKTAKKYQGARLSLQSQIEKTKALPKSKEQKETLKMLKEDLDKQEDIFVGKLAFYAPFDPTMQSPQQWYDSLDWTARRFIAAQLKIEQKIIDALPQENGCTIL